MAVKLTIICIVTFLMNIPFGYWRNNVKKFSVQWFLAVHIPIPFIIIMRIYSDIGFAWYTYPFIIGSFFLGQKAGAVIQKSLSAKCSNTSSFIFTDLLRCIK
ncbi:MAG: hypothetical protein GXO47_05735 [Chlorobi bacterium]|nr:hypothetical protein [Chlorobiota bacterium]